MARKTVRQKPVDSLLDTWWIVKLKDQPGKPGKVISVYPHKTRQGARETQKAWVGRKHYPGGDSPRVGQSEVVQVWLVPV